ncbi:hypothetical protein [Campylobacter concisus]|uniref:hypothetical protein n=1 Tax=Campylobacter concisus TaxID=199 RepID=UPI000CD9BF89|nr:hypothetical protein [Campylobacter concisus]
MTKRADISIDAALQNSNVKTYEMQDKKDKKQKRNTVQVSIYLTQEEIAYLDEKCDETFLARNAYMRKLLVEDMKRKSE